MGVVGGSRHYDGGGLGAIAVWTCPSCGEENTGPLERGCGSCGAGAPGRHVGNPAPPKPPADPKPAPPAEAEEEQLGVFDRWALRHPQATLEEAFTAGYIEGVRDARRQPPAAPAPQGEPIAFSPDHIINRTLVAALELFRDQVLSGNPEETTTGEWLTGHQVTALIKQIQTHMQEGEPAHA